MCELFESQTTRMLSAKNIELAATLDREHDKADRVSGRRIRCPVLVLGAPEERSVHGTSRSLDRSRFGKLGAMRLFKDTRSVPDTSSQKKSRSKRLTL
jgi:hypothetical protein